LRIAFLRTEIGFLRTEVLQKPLYTDFTDKGGWHGDFKESLKIRVIGQISAIRVQKEILGTQLCIARFDRSATTLSSGKN
jgi:hypothetical protein